MKYLADFDPKYLVDIEDFKKKQKMRMHIRYIKKMN